MSDCRSCGGNRALGNYVGSSKEQSRYLVIWHKRYNGSIPNHTQVVSESNISHYRKLEEQGILTIQEDITNAQ